MPKKVKRTKPLAVIAIRDDQINLELENKLTEKGRGYAVHFVPIEALPKGICSNTLEDFITTIVELKPSVAIIYPTEYTNPNANACGEISRLLKGSCVVICLYQTSHPSESMIVNGGMNKIYYIEVGKNNKWETACKKIIAQIDLVTKQDKP